MSVNIREKIGKLNAMQRKKVEGSAVELIVCCAALSMCSTLGMTSLSSPTAVIGDLWAGWHREGRNVPPLLAAEPQG
jgi:hypothetical protein